MHSRSPEDNASAMQYAPHPDSLSARQEAGYPVSQEEVLQEELLFSVNHLSLSHLCQIKDQVIQVHAQPHLPSFFFYKNLFKFVYLKSIYLQIVFHILN